MTTAKITSVSGPVLKARVEQPFQMGEAVRVGERELMGEVIRIQGQEIVVQVYEDTSGLRPGGAVLGNGLPLAVRLGPHLLGGIFDGLLRPLTGTDSAYIEPGTVKTAPRVLPFKPGVKEGDALNAGMRFGNVQTSGGKTLQCLVPPEVNGKVARMAPGGEYAEDATLCWLDDADGAPSELAMSHIWPVRKPRPIVERLPVAGPLLTGQRILDALFPVAQGGKATLPGGFGTGKTVLQESLAKWCDADVIVYVGCGERGNEMSGVLQEFPALEDPRTGRPLMERTVLIANVSNMPVAAREASTYTAVSVAEYFRDQGLHVALMADSTSRWAEALREISGRLGELPAEAGYPAYLSSRLAAFYERAARVRTLSGDEGSVTIIGAVSPAGGDFSEPVTTHTKRYVRSFWALDSARAHARFYPAIHPLQSYSEDVEALASWWQARGDPHWSETRRRFLTLLQQQARLERMARIVGKDALPMRQQLVLLCAQVVSEGFLRQSAISPVDRYCSPERQVRMMRLLLRFNDLAEKAVEAGASVEELYALPVVRGLQRMGEEIPEDHLDQFDSLQEQLETDFATWTRATANVG
ncbi:MAG: V-type ATP synthase subunit A [Betaproteobacteria bacterium]|nr:V-type ATP synthase subunit A [Gammaproteobacteria bacterium]MDH3437261.1 V-type ATP synthase subunit A [Betaproteobacteria bacterium]